MDLLAALPADVLPRVLMYPACVVALRLTRKRGLELVSARIFVETGPTRWESDYWRLEIVCYLRFLATQKCHNGEVLMSNDTNSTAGWGNTKYQFAVREYGYLSGLTTAGGIWGVRYVANRKNIYRLNHGEDVRGDVIVVSRRVCCYESNIRSSDDLQNKLIYTRV